MMNKLKHKLKLLWLRRKWVIQSIYNTDEFREAEYYLDVEKEVDRLYHKAKRGKDKKDIARALGRCEVMEWIKNIKEID